MTLEEYKRAVEAKIEAVGDWTPSECKAMVHAFGRLVAHHYNEGNASDEAYHEITSMNLDGSWPDDLRALAARPEIPQILRQYAAKKARAMELRESGKMGALRLEDELEQIYQRMPAALKW